MAGKRLKPEEREIETKKNNEIKGNKKRHLLLVAVACELVLDEHVLHQPVRGQA